MKIKTWPNGLGMLVTKGRLMIEVWLTHGGCRRMVHDDSLCGQSGTHFSRVAVGSPVEMATAAVESWKNNPQAWSECT